MTIDYRYVIHQDLYTYYENVQETINDLLQDYSEEYAEEGDIRLYIEHAKPSERNGLYCCEIVVELERLEFE